MLSIIIKREFLARVRNKSFVMMTFLSPLLMVLMAGIITYLTQVNTSETKKIAVFNPEGQLRQILFDTDSYHYDFLNEIDEEKAKTLAFEQNYYGLLVHNADKILFYTEESVNPSFIRQLENKIDKYKRAEWLKSNGLDPNMLEREAGTQIDLQHFTGKSTSKTGLYVKMIFGGLAGYLIMMFIVIYGNMVMRSVIEEKTNRVIEIIISSVKPYQLMMGKILGNTLAGILQFSVWIFIGYVLLQLAGSWMYPAQPETLEMAGKGMMGEILSEIQQLPLAFMTLSFLFYFVGGYLLYSSIYAAIGAAVDSETDTQQFMLPIILPLILGVYVGFFTVIENPHGTVSTVFSFIPFTSPIVMLMRIPFGVPWWQWIISLLLLLAAYLLVVWIAAKIYRIGILMYGKKPSYRELLRWLKY